MATATRARPLAGDGIAFQARHEHLARWTFVNVSVRSVASRRDDHVVQINVRIDDGKVNSKRSRSCYAGIELSAEDARALAAELLKDLP